MEIITRQYYLPATLLAKANLNRLCRLIACHISEVKRVEDFLVVVLSYRKNDTNIVKRILSDSGANL